jgi:hypothetical protein
MALENRKERDNYVEVDIDERVILKLILGEEDAAVGT